MNEVAIEQIKRLESDLIESIEPDLEVTASAQEIPWGVRRVGATAITSSASINNTDNPISTHIFVLDTGVSLHPDLNVVEQLSFVSTEKSVIDLNGHGTAVAGVAAARDNTFGVVGVAPGAPVHSYKCLDSNGSGSFSSIIAALDKVAAWKLANTASRCVVNMSLGGYTGSFAYTALDSTTQKLIVQYGIPVVVAAGNSGDLATLYSPAHTVEAITVGAYDSNNGVTTWSNYGGVVDILAPGANVLTTSYNKKTKKYGYITYNGTSFSCPHVAGAVALYLAANPNAIPSDISSALRTIASQAQGAGLNPAISSNFPDTTNLSIWVA
jgi:subtilisin